MNRRATDRLHHLSGAVFLCMMTVLLTVPFDGLAPLRAAESTEYGGEVDPIEETDIAPVAARRRRVLPGKESIAGVRWSLYPSRCQDSRSAVRDEGVCRSQLNGLYPLRR